jgi:DNA polymerase III epsilon subunit-like protein
MLDLFLDTETTGLANNQPHDHPSQPDCIQLAAQLYSGRKLVSEFQFIMANRLDCPIHPAAAAAHGLTQEFVVEHGCNPKLPLTCLKQMLSKADRVFAYNMGFDWKILTIAMLRNFGEDMSQFRAEVLCTMLSIHGKVPRRDGSNRWPTLMDAYCALIDPAGFDGAHDAMQDVRALVKVTHAAEDRGIAFVRPKGF